MISLEINELAADLNGQYTPEEASFQVLGGAHV
jgi:hypothetical protein